MPVGEVLFLNALFSFIEGTDLTPLKGESYFRLHGSFGGENPLNNSIAQLLLISTSVTLRVATRGRRTTGAVTGLFWS